MTQRKYPHLPVAPRGYHWEVFDYGYGEYGEVTISDVCLYRERRHWFDKRINSVLCPRSERHEAAAARHILRLLEI